jgi:hypothetical protein
VPIFFVHKVTTVQSSEKWRVANHGRSPTFPGTGWANTEFRIFEFRDSVDDDDLYGTKHGGDNASIVETVESRKRRGRPGEPPSRDLQKAFFQQAMAGWENQLIEDAQREAQAVQEAAEAVADGVDGENVVTEEVEVATS